MTRLRHQKEIGVTSQDSVLIIDNHSEDLPTLQAVLSELGLNPIQASCSTATWQHLARQDFAVILLDVQTLGTNASEIIQQVRRQPRSQRTPILLIGNADQVKDAAQEYPPGVVDRLSRPLVPELLKARITVLREFYSLAQQLKQQAEQLADCRQQLSAINLRLEDEVEARQKEWTASRQLVELLEATQKELEVLGYSVSHDLHAPLRGIDSFTQALLEDCADKLDPQGREYLERIRANAHRMAELLDALVKLSRLSSADLYRQPVDLSAVARAIAKDLQERDPQRQVTFVIGAGIAGEGDALLLRSVLENLLGNAWKYTSKLPRATIEFGVTHQAGRPAYFVHDDGAGFDMTYVSKLFGAFQRLHPPSEFPGNGIGLAMVARIIHRHGGEVWAEGRVGKGATFYFTLP